MPMTHPKAPHFTVPSKPRKICPPPLRLHSLASSSLPRSPSPAPSPPRSLLPPSPSTPGPNFRPSSKLDTVLLATTSVVELTRTLAEVGATTSNSEAASTAAASAAASTTKTATATTTAATASALSASSVNTSRNSQSSPE